MFIVFILLFIFIAFIAACEIWMFVTKLIWKIEAIFGFGPDIAVPEVVEVEPEQEAPQRFRTSSLMPGNYPCREEYLRARYHGTAKLSPLASEHLADLRAARGVYTS